MFHNSKRLIKFSETFEILVAATFPGGIRGGIGIVIQERGIKPSNIIHYEEHIFATLFFNALMMDKIVDKLLWITALKNIFKLYGIVFYLFKYFARSLQFCKLSLQTS